MRGENRKKILEFIRLKHPAAVTSAEIARRTGVSQPQIYQITKDLMQRKMVRGARDGRVWKYTWNGTGAQPGAAANDAGAPGGLEQFGRRASAALEELEGAQFTAQPQEGAANVLALSGAEAAALALYFTAAPGERVPYARLAFINGHVWLLERMEADNLYLILGGDEATARAWAEQFAPLCADVSVLWLSSSGGFEQLT